jgi:hypothetical protein
MYLADSHPIDFLVPPIDQVLAVLGRRMLRWRLRWFPLQERGMPPADNSANAGGGVQCQFPPDLAHHSGVLHCRRRPSVLTFAPPEGTAKGIRQRQEG